MDILNETAATSAAHPGCPALPDGDLWVFAYGSLIWDPGFPFVESRSALLRGYHRSFCIWSARYRGTPERPGLVLGLDRGGACRGVVYRVAEAHVSEVLRLLWAREMPRLTYVPRVLRVATEESNVAALTFLADTRRSTYAGAMSEEQVAQRIACCTGARGPNVDYLANTVGHLRALGVHDAHLARIYAAVQSLGQLAQ